MGPRFRSLQGSLSVSKNDVLWLYTEIPQLKIVFTIKYTDALGTFTNYCVESVTVRQQSNKIFKIYETLNYIWQLHTCFPFMLVINPTQIQEISSKI